MNVFTLRKAVMKLLGGQLSTAVAPVISQMFLCVQRSLFSQLLPQATAVNKNMLLAKLPG